MVNQNTKYTFVYEFFPVLFTITSALFEATKMASSGSQRKLELVDYLYESVKLVISAIKSKGPVQRKTKNIVRLEIWLSHSGNLPSLM